MLPSSPNNLIDFTLSWAYPPEVSGSFLTATVLVGSAVSPGVYASWCVDAQTGLLPGLEGYAYAGNLYSSTDPNLNQILAMETTSASVLVGAEVWKQVNYLLNHRTGYDYWDVQAAIWHFIGGPAVATPPYPYFNMAAVNQLVSDTLSNAPGWCPGLGDKMAAVAVIIWPVDNQILIFETSCSETTPGLAVSVGCPSDCGLVSYGGSVSNTGNVTLTNLIVLSSQPSDNTFVLSLLSLAPGASAAFAGNYFIPCVTNLLTNTVSIVTTNTVGVVSTNTVLVVTTNTAGEVTTNTAFVITTNTVPVVTTNTAGVVTTNTVLVVTTNTVPVVTTNTILVVTTNTLQVVTTNLISVIVTNLSVTVTTNATTPTFGTIDPVMATLTDRFVVPDNLRGFMFADQDQNWGPTLFYSIRHPGSGADVFDTISTLPPLVGTVTDRFPLSSDNYDALTLAAPDVGYGAVNFYYVRHDNSGGSTFGVIKVAGASSSADLWPLARSGYNALAFAAANLGYGANMFYFLRQDNSGLSTFGTINPTPGGIATDLYSVGANFDALVFVPGAVSTWGTALFAYLRHDTIGSTIGTIDPVTHVVTDRLNLGQNLLSALTFTATDVGYGPNLFYYLRPGGLIFTTNTVTGFTTNEVMILTTNDVVSFTTNSLTTLTTNNAVSFATNTVTTFTTNMVTTFTTNDVVSFTTNSVTTFATNSVTTLATNTVTTFTTNNVTTFATNNMITVTTNILATATTNTVTVSGTDVCQGRTVTATTTCSVPGTQLAPFVIGGGGAAPVRLTNGSFSLSFPTRSGESYTVQYKTSFSDLQWTNLETVSGTGGIVTITHHMQGQPRCFYRVVVSP